MHSAPSVSYPVGRSRMGRRAAIALWLAGACCVGAWRAQYGGNDWRWALVLGAFLIASLAAARALRPVAARELRWDGAAWSLSAPQPMGMAQAAVALDLQAAVLVRLDEAGRAAQWLWLEKSAMPERWNALRRAVYCRAPGPQDAAPSLAAATPAPRAPDLSA